jgi:hypothetical protein
MTSLVAGEGVSAGQGGAVPAQSRPDAELAWARQEQALGGGGGGSGSGSGGNVARPSNQSPGRTENAAWGNAREERGHARGGLPGRGSCSRRRLPTPLYCSPLSAGLLRQGTNSTVQFGALFFFTKTLEARKGEEANFCEKALGDLAASAVGALVGSPVDLALIRMQADVTLPEAQRRHYKNAFQMLTRISKDEGVLAL